MPSQGRIGEQHGFESVHTTEPFLEFGTFRTRHVASEATVVDYYMYVSRQSMVYQQR